MFYTSENLCLLVEKIAMNALPNDGVVFQEYMYIP